MAGVRWLERLSVSTTVDDVIVCAGAQHALSVTISHLGARRPALYVEELTYPGMHGIAEIAGLPLIPVATDAYGMSPVDLERAWRRHGPGIVYCMPTIHNPVGAVMSAARRRAIADVTSSPLSVTTRASGRTLRTATVDNPFCGTARIPSRGKISTSAGWSIESS